jgi:hypothetical protein
VINNYYNTTIVNKSVTVNNVKYVNQGVPGAVTATSPHAFTSAQPVGRNMVAVNQHEIATAPAAVHAPAVVPPKQAVLGAGAAATVHPPATIQSRAVVARNTPPPPPPSFAVRQAAIEKNQGRPISAAEERQLQPAPAHGVTPQVKVAPPANPGTPHYNTAQRGGNKGNVQPGPLTTSRPPNNVGPTNGTPGNRPANTRAYEDRPQNSRPTGTTTVNPQLEQKHQQQIQQLQQKQDQQYQKLQQKQNLEQQKVNEQTQQQIQQKQQQQLEELQQKQQQQQRNLKQKQEAEHAKAYKEPPAKPKPEDKPHK